MAINKYISTWNNYFKVKSNSISIEEWLLNKMPVIAYGNGRSYGDAPLNENIVETRSQNKIIHFDSDSGVIHCQAGITIESILKHIVPYGWILHVMPGTKYITIGGAIAANVHGKNHFEKGSFGDYVLEFTLMTSSGNLEKCNRNANTELYFNTIGGMGLTGIILDVKIKLELLHGDTVVITNTKITTIHKLLDQFYKSMNEYKIAWIKNCDPDKFESIFTCADLLKSSHPKTTNFKFKSFKMYRSFDLINTVTVKVFNRLKYALMSKNETMNLFQFLFPLDTIEDWNKLYGSHGFVQYQFVIPDSERDTLNNIFYTINTYSSTPFLITLKQFGVENSYSPLSFPMKGFTVTFDFKITNDLFSLLNSLDQLVLHSKGRVYLAKDSRLSAAVFQKMYPDWIKCMVSHGSDSAFTSLLSKRLGITHDE